jgi:hypothetical protein
MPLLFFYLPSLFFLCPAGQRGGVIWVSSLASEKLFDSVFL